MRRARSPCGAFLIARTVALPAVVTAQSAHESDNVGSSIAEQAVFVANR